MLNFFLIVLIAVSLSMDTFSLSTAYGLLGYEKRKIIIISIVVGIYHFFMPMIGNAVGSHIVQKIPIQSNFIIASIFIILSIEMFFQKNEFIQLSGYMSIFMFGFAVSLDSFTVGIGISQITDHCFLAYTVFALVSCFFTFLGIKFGNIIGYKIGKNSSMLGSLILFILGITYIM